MFEETIPQVSAIFIVGLITGLIAYYLSLCKHVKEFIDDRKEEYAVQISEYYTRLAEKSGLFIQPLPKNWTELFIKIQKDTYIQALKLQERILFEGYDVKRSLETMRNSFFGAIILFVLAIALSYSVYSSYAISSFLLAIFLLVYGIYLFVRISKIFWD